MHSDDTHKKDGFFSKIFGHHDDATMKSDDANVIKPSDAASVGLADTPAVNGVEPNPAPSLDPIDFASKQSGDTSSASQDDTLQLHEVAGAAMPTETAAETEPPTSEASTPPVDNAAHETDTASESTLSSDPLKGSVADVLAVSKDTSEPLDLNAHASTSPAEPSSDTADETGDMHADNITTSDDKETTVETPASESSDKPIAQPSSEETSLSAADASASSTSSESAVNTASEASPVAAETLATEIVPDAPSAPSIEPPAPPVEEGAAWLEAHKDSVSPDVKPDEVPDDKQPDSPQSTLTEAQTQVDKIFEDHPDFTNTATAPSADEKPSETSEDSKDTTTHDASAVSSAQPPEIQAAVARLEQHIDDLESGLQKVRAELAALRK